MLSRLQGYLRNKYVIGALVALVVLVYFVFFRQATSSQETLVLSRADFKQQVSISGTVVAAKRVDLGFTQSGRVAHVYVDAGQNVAAGALLADIDNQDLAANVSQREAALASQQAKLESLKQGTRPEEIAVAQATVDSDTQSLAQANQAVVDAIRDSYTTADDAVRNKVYQFVSNPRSLNPDLNFPTSDSMLETRFYNELTTQEGEFSGWQQATITVNTDSLSSVYTETQTDLSAIVQLLSDAAALINRALPTTSIPQTTLDAYATSVAAGRTAVNAAITALTSARTAQKNAQSALDSAQKNLTLKKAGAVQADIDAQAALVAAAQADVENARAQLSKTRISASFAGIVTNVDAEVGKIVSPNTAEISMISSGVLQVETYIPEVSIVNVALGQSASVTLDAYGESVNFPATIVAIDPAETVKSGVSTYKTTLQFSTPDTRIRPGMTANVIITTATIPNAIAIPQGAVYERDGANYVQVMVNKKPVEHAVTIGTTSTLGSVVVQSGLNEGDTLVLNPTH